MNDPHNNEMPRPVKAKALAEAPYEITADTEERAALAMRFAVNEIAELSASVILAPKGDAVVADGTLTARWTQACAVSGEELPMTTQEPFVVRFVPADPQRYAPDEEVDLTADDCDEIEYTGGTFDLGEAVAQSFGLAIDPYATGANAEEARKRAGLQTEGEEDGLLAELLAGLKTD
ncbi:MAG: DUF177 domain-containing protein [Pontixanthobacter sp.]